jgi:hypothetical protein
MLDGVAGAIASLGAETWQRDALCVEYYPQVDWFPELGEIAEAARAICRACAPRLPFRARL